MREFGGGAVSKPGLIAEELDCCRKFLTFRNLELGEKDCGDTLRQLKKKIFLTLDLETDTSPCSFGAA